MTRFIINFLAILGVGVAIWVWSARAPSILVEDATARVLRDGAVDISFSLRNDGPPDRLIGVASDMGQAVLVAPDSGEAGVPIAAEHTSIFSVDGAVVRLTGVEGGLAEGRLVPVTLMMERAGAVGFKARTDPPMMAMHGMHGAALLPEEEGEPAPSVSLSVEPDTDGGWTLALETEHFRFAQNLVDSPHVPGTGHAHLYVGSVKLGRLYAPMARIPPLPPGRHVVRVTLNSNDHRVYAVGGDPVSATLEVEAR